MIHLGFAFQTLVNPWLVEVIKTGIKCRKAMVLVRISIEDTKNFAKTLRVKSNFKGFAIQGKTVR